MILLEYFLYVCMPVNLFFCPPYKESWTKDMHVSVAINTCAVSGSLLVRVAPPRVRCGMGWGFARSTTIDGGTVCSILGQGHRSVVEFGVKVGGGST